MQTFLPYPDFALSASCLDDRRLNNQINEANTIFNTLLVEDINPKVGWRYHPATKMWRGWPSSLSWYINCCIEEWEERGGENSRPRHKLPRNFKLRVPEWLTDNFCRSHQSNLLRKNPEWYSQFGWDVPDNLEYVWPVR